MITNRNERTVTVKMTRQDLCNINLALTLISQSSDANKWQVLKDKMKEQLDKFDKKLDSEN